MSLARRKITHLSIGNFNLDITLYVDRIPGPDESVLASTINVRPGGAATNYAVAVASYGHKPYLLATVSEDELVRRYLSMVEEAGVDVSLVQKIRGEPGIVVIFVYPGGERSMVKYPGVNSALARLKIPLEVLERVQVVHIASAPPSILSAIGDKAKGNATLLSYDPGIHVNDFVEDNLRLLRFVDTLFLNKKEAKILLEKNNLDSVFAQGVKRVVVKAGSRGAYLLNPRGQVYLGACKIEEKVVDTTGAGDAFDAFFNATLAETGDELLSIQHGVVAGALKTLCRSSFICFDKKVFNKYFGRSEVVEVGLDDFVADVT
mgnify:CR=1 FL=1